MYTAEIKPLVTKTYSGKLALVRPVEIAKDGKPIETIDIGVVKEDYALSDAQIAEEAVTRLASRGFEVVIPNNARQFTMIEQAVGLIMEGAVEIVSVNS